MNKIFKVISLAAAAALCAGALAGCGSGTPDSQVEESGEAAKADVLVMGTNAEFQPF